MSTLAEIQLALTYPSLEPVVCTLFLADGRSHVDAKVRVLQYNADGTPYWLEVAVFDRPMFLVPWHAVVAVTP